MNCLVFILLMTFLTEFLLTEYMLGFGIKKQFSVLHNDEGPEGVKWELGFASFWAGKMGFVHWDWDFTTGNGTNTLENGNGISLLCETC